MIHIPGLGPGSTLSVSKLSPNFAHWPGGVIWLGDTESPRPDPCAFCAEPAQTIEPKTHWALCSHPSCNAAAAAQKERMYAGLVDCPETRESALRWAKVKLDEVPA